MSRLTMNAGYQINIQPFEPTSLFDGENVSNDIVEFEEGEDTELESGSTLSVLFGKIKKLISSLKQVCFSGSYNDLEDVPTGTLTIKQDDITLGNFSANSTEDVEINIEGGGGDYPIINSVGENLLQIVKGLFTPYFIGYDADNNEIGALDISYIQYNVLSDYNRIRIRLTNNTSSVISYVVGSFGGIKVSVNGDPSITFQYDNGSTYNISNGYLIPSFRFVRTIAAGGSSSFNIELRNIEVIEYEDNIISKFYDIINSYVVQNPNFGTEGQVLTNNGDGTYEWADSSGGGSTGTVVWKNNDATYYTPTITVGTSGLEANIDTSDYMTSDTISVTASVFIDEVSHDFNIDLYTVNIKQLTSITETLFLSNNYSNSSTGYEGFYHNDEDDADYTTDISNISVTAGQSSIIQCDYTNFDVSGYSVVELSLTLENPNISDGALGLNITSGYVTLLNEETQEQVLYDLSFDNTTLNFAFTEGTYIYNSYTQEQYNLMV